MSPRCLLHSAAGSILYAQCAFPQCSGNPAGDPCSGVIRATLNQAKHWRIPSTLGLLNGTTRDVGLWPCDFAHAWRAEGCLYVAIIVRLKGRRALDNRISQHQRLDTHGLNLVQHGLDALLPKHISLAHKEHDIQCHLYPLCWMLIVSAHPGTAKGWKPFLPGSIVCPRWSGKAAHAGSEPPLWHTRSGP